MQLDKKIFNSRLCNSFEDLGSLVKGITKDINEIADITINLENYGVQVHNVAKDLKDQVQNEDTSISRKKKDGNQASNAAPEPQFETEGLLGRMPDDVESIAELMLQDSDVNVYQESKVVLKEEAFTIRGKKLKTQKQKEQLINDRKNKAWQQYQELVKKQQTPLLAEDNIPLMKPLREQEIYHDPSQDFVFQPKAREITPLLVNENLTGVRNAKDFDNYTQQVEQRTNNKTMISHLIDPTQEEGQIDTTGM